MVAGFGLSISPGIPSAFFTPVDEREERNPESQVASMVSAKLITIKMAAARTSCLLYTSSSPRDS